MIEIKWETPMIQISRDIMKAIKEKDLPWDMEDDMDFENQLFISRIVNLEDETVVFEAKRSSWRDALIEVHKFIWEE